MPSEIYYAPEADKKQLTEKERKKEVAKKLAFTKEKKTIKHTLRTPKRWLSTTLPEEVEAYRKIVFEEYGAELSQNLQLVINGVFDSRKVG